MCTRADFAVEVLLESYSNPGHNASGLGGNCCESDCDDSCHNKFKFCLTTTGGVEHVRSDTCSYGYQETRVVEMNDNSLFDPRDVFRGVNDEFSNPLMFSGQEWIVRFNFVYVYMYVFSLLAQSLQLAQAV